MQVLVADLQSFRLVAIIWDMFSHLVARNYLAKAFLLALLGGFSSVGAVTPLLTGADSYRSLRSANIAVHFPQSYEREAREFLPRAQAYVEGLQNRVGFRYQRPIEVFLTSRRFPNAFVTGQQVGIDNHIVLPMDLLYPELFMAGFSGSHFDIFVHEITHHYQLEVGRHWFGRFFGPFIPYDFLATPSWVWEGYAVYFESTPQKGRIREAYFKSLLRSALQEEERELVPFDFYDENKDWFASGGAAYLMGSHFMEYLARQYGEEALHAFVYDTTQFTFRSDLQKHFGKNFRQLLTELNAEIRSQARRERAPFQREHYFKRSADIRGLTELPNGEIVFWERKENEETKLVWLDASGRLRDQWSWKRVFRAFFHRDLDVPNQVKVSPNGRHLYFHSWADSRDGLSIDGVLARFDLQAGSLEVLLSQNDIQAADFSDDAKTFYTLKKVYDANGAYFAIHKGDLPNAQSLSLVAKIQGPEQISSFSVSPDQKNIVLSGYRQGSWNLYLQSLESPTAPLKPLLNSTAQELAPRWGRDGQIYFLGDEKGHYQLHRVSPTGAAPSLCQGTNVPWFLRDFTLSADPFYVQRRGRFWSVDRGVDWRCAPLPVAQAETPTGVPLLSQAPVYTENPWQVFIPRTRVVIPFFGDDDVGVTGIIAGESPYKKVSWVAQGLYSSEDPQDSQGVAQVLFSSFEPHILGFTFDSTPGYLRSAISGQRDPRYQTLSLTLLEPLHSHIFEVSPFYRTSRGLPDQKGLTLMHRFASQSGSMRSVGPKRGIALSESLSFFPRSWGNQEALNLYRFDQEIYLPLLVQKTDSFSVSSSQFVIDSDSNEAHGLICGPGWGQDYGPGRRNLSLQSTVVDARISVLGLGSRCFRGKKAWGGEVAYKFAIGERDFGTQHLGDRLYFSPRLTNWRMGPYIAAAQFFGQGDRDKKIHAAWGGTLEFQWSLVDFVPLQSMVYWAQRLSDDKKSETGAYTGVYLSF